MDHFSMKKQASPPQNPQSGSIFIWIFVMIALFGALSYAMIQSGRQGGANLSAEQTRLAASEILDYGRAVKDAIRAMSIDGCTDTQISFEGGSTNGTYTNASAPADKHCHVFDPAGANLKAPQMSDGWGDERLFFGANVVESHDSSAQAGTSAPDLTMIRQVNRETCAAINAMVLGSTLYWESPSGQKHGMWESEGDHNGSRYGGDDSLVWWDTFQGDYSNSPGRHITINDGSLPNGGANDDTKVPPSTGCFCESDDECDADTYPATTYYYYNVLISR